MYQGWGWLQWHDYDNAYMMITKNDYDYDYSQRKLITITIMIAYDCKACINKQSCNRLSVVTTFIQYNTKQVMCTE